MPQHLLMNFLPHGRPGLPTFCPATPALELNIKMVPGTNAGDHFSLPAAGAAAGGD